MTLHARATCAGAWGHGDDARVVRVLGGVAGPRTPKNVLPLVELRGGEGGGAEGRLACNLQWLDGKAAYGVQGL